MRGLVARKVRSAGTLTMQEGHVPWLLRELGDCPLEDLTARRLDDLVDKAIESGLDPRTVQKRFSTLRQACKLAVRHRQLAELPPFPLWEFPPQGRPKTRWAESWEEVAGIYAQLPPERGDWLALVLGSGQHASDAERMVWRDTRLKEGEILLRCTKNRKPDGVWVKCPRFLLKILRARYDRLRPRPGDKIVKPWPASLRFVQLGSACIRAGYEPINANGLRHTGATFVAAELGITVGMCKFFGWSSYKMAETVYAHALKGGLADVSRALDGPRLGPLAAKIRARQGGTTKRRGVR